MSEYLQIPLALGEITRKTELLRIDTKQSIHEMVHLIAITSFEEVKHLPHFGSAIWEYDFENVLNYFLLNDQLRNSIRKSVLENEKRLSKVNVDLEIEQVESGKKKHDICIKTVIKLLVSGLIKKTNEQFTHHESFFIGPLSY